MIKFYRRIRKKLIKENKLGKYLAYSIGEIALVVIGIMIALQLNNANDLKKQLNLESKLLKELVSNLNQQAKDIVLSRDFHIRAKGSCEIIREALLLDADYADSLPRHFMLAYTFTNLYNPRNAYKMIESEGVNIIRNDSLRHKITKYYDEHIPFQFNIQEVTTKQILSASEEHTSLFKNFSWNAPMEPWDFEALKENRAYISWLSYTASNRTFEAERFSVLLNANRQLIAAIEREL